MIRGNNNYEKEKERNEKVVDLEKEFKKCSRYLNFKYSTPTFTNNLCEDVIGYQLCLQKNKFVGVNTPTTFGTDLMWHTIDFTSNIPAHFFLHDFQRVSLKRPTDPQTSKPCSFFQPTNPPDVEPPPPWDFRRCAASPRHTNHPENHHATSLTAYANSGRGNCTAPSLKSTKAGSFPPHVVAIFGFHRQNQHLPNDCKSTGKPYNAPCLRAVRKRFMWDDCNRYVFV